MLQIRVNDQNVDLEGVKFNLQLNSPIPFSPEEGMVEGSFAFGVTFPGSPVNKKIFGFPHRLELYPEPESEFQGLLFFNGRLLFKVIISITQASDVYFRANIKVDMSTYASQIGDKSLRDLVYDGEESIGNSTAEVIAHCNDVVTKTYPEVKYNFPETYHPLFYGEEKKMNPTWSELMNNYIHGTGFHANSIDMDQYINNYYNICPWPYLVHVLKHCYSEFGYNPGGPVFRDPELASVLIYNNYALDDIRDRYKSHVQLSADQYITAESLVEFDDVLINIDTPWQEDEFRYEVKKSGNHRISLSMIFDLPEFSEIIAEYDIWIKLGDDTIHYFSGNVSHEEPLEMHDTFVHLITSGDIGKFITMRVRFMYDAIEYPGFIRTGSWWTIQNDTWSNYNSYKTSINLANHVPDIKISSFLVTLLKTFGIVHQFSSSTRDVTLMFLKDILASVGQEDYTDFTVKSTKFAGFREHKSYKLSFAWSSADEYTKENFKPIDNKKLIGTFATFADLPALSNEGDQAIILNLHAAYRFETDTWVWFTDLHYPLEIGDGVTAISLEASPLMMHDNRSNPANPLVCPKILQEGSSENLGVKEFGFHIMFYRGMQLDANGHEYPFASSTKYGPTGAAVGSYEYILDSADGLYQSFLEGYYTLIMNRTRPVEYEKYFSASDIQRLDFLGKKRIFQHVYLLKELSIPMSNTSIGVASIKLQKI